MGRALSLARVLVRLKVVNNGVRVRFRLLFKAASGGPRGRLFVLPFLDHRVARVAEMLGPLQGKAVIILSLYQPALLVLPHHFLSLSRGGEALLATMPMATVVLKDRAGLGMITINRMVADVSLSPMATQRVMDVNAPLLCLPLEPFDCHEAATTVGVEGSLVG